MQLGDDGKAQEHFEQCLTIACSIKHQEMECECERNLGEIALGAGNLQAAQARFARSLKVCRDAEDKRNEAIALWCLAKTDTVTGDHGSARKKLGDALGAFRALEMRAEALDCLEDCAVLLYAVGESDSAVRLQAAAAAVRGALALPRSLRDEAKRQENIDAVRAALGKTAFDAAWSDGERWALDEAIDYALTSSAVPAVAA
jgi:tetratricopeptide (TPR) repeat protein